MARVRGRMDELGVDVLLLSIGADLPWLTGYEALETERLTMLVLPRDGDATLVVPRLEADRVREEPDAFSIVAWDETDDPIDIVVGLAGAPATAAVGDHTWARFLLELQRALPRTSFRKASEVTAPLRRVKDAAEIEALRAAARAVDGIVDEMRDRPFGGRTEIRCAPGARAADARRRARAGQLRHRRLGTERRPARTTRREPA